MTEKQVIAAIIAGGAAAVFAMIIAWSAGFSNGRIYECRRMWATVGDAPTVWRLCDEDRYAP